MSAVNDGNNLCLRDDDHRGLMQVVNCHDTCERYLGASAVNTSLSSLVYGDNAAPEFPSNPSRESVSLDAGIWP